MKKNLGGSDRAIRLMIALVLAALFVTNVIPGTLGIIALIISGVFVLTSFSGFCPLYALFGITTCPLRKA
ncbi:MAG: YgaP family membrane protein [Bacteroidota bacterium]